MTDHRRPAQRQPGILATFNGECSRCGGPVIAYRHRIVPRPGGGYIHVDCASGAHDG